MREVLAVAVPAAASMVVVPLETACTSPAELTVATDGFEEVH